MEDLQRARIILAQSRNMVFFGGAGVSTESGIPDFRSAGGVYARAFAYPPETVLSLSFFNRLPDVFYEFYRDRCLRPMLGASPNPAHLTLARWEGEGRLRVVITQNIDGLHQKAGSRNVLELHGTARSNHCLACGQAFSLEEMLQGDGPARCGCGGLIRPDVVLFEEALDRQVLDQAERQIRRADVLIVAGSSMSVFPAAGLARCFACSHLILINRDASSFDRYADIILRGKVGEILGTM